MARSTPSHSSIHAIAANGLDSDVADALGGVIAVALGFNELDGLSGT